MQYMNFLVCLQYWVQFKGDKFQFAEDAIFSSPSAASNMVLGRNSNGFTEWVNKKGQTFRDVQEITNANNV